MIIPAPNEEFFNPKRFALLLALALGVIYFRVLFAGDTFYYRDFGVLAVPTAMYHKTSLLAGQIPFWNPFSNCGAPFLAQWGTMVLYPLSLIYVLLPMPWSLNFFCIVHLWLGGMGIYLLARRWSASAWPAAVAGFAFTFNGITQAALAWPNYIAALAWFPWIVLFNDRLWNAESKDDFYSPKSRAGAFILAVFASSMQLLAGVPELAVLTWILVTVLWAAHILSTPLRRKSNLLAYLGVIAASSGVISIQLLPFLELLSNSHRAPGFAAEKWALPIWGWANLILPRFHTFVTPQGTVFQYGQEFLTSIYLGVPLVVLAIAACLERTRRVWILACASLLALILALGSRGIIYSIATGLLPLLSIARYPVKFLFLLVFTVPLLAAFGCSNLAALPPRRSKLFLGSLGALALIIIGALMLANQLAPFEYDRVHEFRLNSWWRIGFAVLLLAALTSGFAAGPKQRLAQVAFLLLFIADAKNHLTNLNPVLNASALQGNIWTQGQKLPKPKLGEGRIFISPEAESHLLRSLIPGAERDFFGKRLAEWSHLNLLDQIPKVNGSSTLQVREEAILQNSLYSGTNQQLEAWLDFLNVRYQTASNSVVEWQARSNYMAFVSAGQRPIFEAVNPLEKPFDFRGQAAIHSLVNEARRVSRADVSISNIIIRENEIRFDANAAAPTVAIIAQTWYPAWKAEVSAQGQHLTRPVLRANLAFQAVLIPGGQSHVRVYYEDHLFKLGAAISGATILLSLLGWVREKKNTLLTDEKSAA